MKAFIITLLFQEKLNSKASAIVVYTSITVYNKQHTNQLTILVAWLAELSEHNVLIYVHGECIPT